jgi:hypothetical protein
MMDRIRALVRRMVCQHEEWLRTKGGERICTGCGIVRE